MPREVGVQYQQPCVRAVLSANHTIANNTDTALAFGAERFDQAHGASSTMHDNATNVSRLTCLEAGIYQITGHAYWQNNVTGIRRLKIRLNGATFLCWVTNDALANDGDAPMTITTLYQLAVNDYVELIAFQNSGTSLNVLSLFDHGGSFMMVRVG